MVRRNLVRWFVPMQPLRRLARGAVFRNLARDATMRKLGRFIMTSEGDSLNLVGLNELPTIGRGELEGRARRAVSPVYLGDSVALCRILGRYKFYIDTRDVGFGAHILLDGFWEIWL